MLIAKSLRRTFNTLTLKNNIWLDDPNFCICFPGNVTSNQFADSDAKARDICTHVICCSLQNLNHRFKFTNYCFDVSNDQQNQNTTHAKQITQIQ